MTFLTSVRTSWHRRQRQEHADGLLVVLCALWDDNRMLRSLCQVNEHNAPMGVGRQQDKRTRSAQIRLTLPDVGTL